MVWAAYKEKAGVDLDEDESGRVMPLEIYMDDDVQTYHLEE